MISWSTIKYFIFSINEANISVEENPVLYLYTLSGLARNYIVLSITDSAKYYLDKFFDDITRHFVNGKLYGNEISLNFGATYKPSSDWYLNPMIEFTSINDNDNGFGGSSLIGFGGVYGRKISEKIGLNIGARYFVGSANDGDLDISGIQFNTGLTAEL